ncbi:hypothetical protein ACFQ36_02450 [Arthrobacter sp. GCM10027362]|uniref:hypothetical protein n=1 Tax=Arthrobacter sp. GCM10027362 TaxID=3273379 RepID=UPI0036374D6B
MRDLDIPPPHFRLIIRGIDYRIQALVPQSSDERVDILDDEGDLPARVSARRQHTGEDPGNSWQLLYRRHAGAEARY